MNRNEYEYEYQNVETPSAPVGSSNSSSGGRKRIVSKPEDLVFYTDTDASDYPIYVLSNREIVYKKKMQDAVVTFYVKDIQKVDNNDITHELLQKAIEAIREITKHEPNAVVKYEITYEIYRNAMTKLIGEAKAYVIKIISHDTPYSYVKYAGRKAFAIAYDWRDRIVAKYNELSQYIYVTGETGRKERASARVVVKLPITTPEFNKLFNIALTSGNQHNLDLEKQVRELEELIKQKEAELQTLREQLQQLKAKLTLEELKRKVIEQ